MFQRFCLALLAGTFLCCTAPQALAQAFITTSGNQIFEFQGSSSGDNQFNFVSAQPPNAVFSTFTRNTVQWTTAANVFNSDNWGTGASIDTTRYVTFTITPNAGFQVQLNALTFDVQATGNGPTQGQIRMSNDGFATFSSFGYTPTGGTTNVIWNFPAFTSIAPVSFRMYGYGATNANGAMRFDNVFATGGTSPVPEPLGIMGVTFGGLAAAGWVRRRRNQKSPAFVETAPLDA